MKIATFNVEWFCSCFGDQWKKWDGTIPPSFSGKKAGGIVLAPVRDVPGLCQRIAGVVNDVNADVIGIQEGPPLKAQMELFVSTYLQGRYVVYQSNERRQSVYALVRKDLSNSVTQIFPVDPLLSSDFFYYPWLGYRPGDRKRHHFDRVPLVLQLGSGGPELVIVHTKSKFSKLHTKEQWDRRDEEAVLDALNARQKLSGELGQLRRYIDSWLNESNNELVVMGDFNDGPFQDLMEREFLLYDILDELVGSFLKPRSCLHHAMTPENLETAWTVRFPDPLEDGKLTEELVDHILVSSSVSVRQGSCKVETEAYDRFNSDVNHSDRGLRPSDHRPVSVVLDC